MTIKELKVNIDNYKKDYGIDSRNDINRTKIICNALDSLLDNYDPDDIVDIDRDKIGKHHLYDIVFEEVESITPIYNGELVEWLARDNNFLLVDEYIESFGYDDKQPFTSMLRAIYANDIIEGVQDLLNKLTK